MTFLAHFGLPCIIDSGLCAASAEEIRVINVAEVIAGNEGKRNHYARERNTASMIQKVVSCQHIEGLTGEGMWRLASLTWITKGGRKVSPDYWKAYKIPTLAYFFRKGQVKRRDLFDLPSSIAALDLPDAVAEAANEETGVVNFYAARRNSALPWCNAHAASLRKLVRDASKLRSNDQARFELAARIEKLPGIPLPSGTKPVPASQLLTPLIASLDPRSRFPVVNGRAEVNQLLGRMQLASHDLETQVKGLVGLIDRFGISDALMIDVCAKEIAEGAQDLPKAVAQGAAAAEGAALEEYDESERLAIKESGTVQYRHRHHKITNALIGIFAALKPEQGRMSNSRYDVLLRNYDGAGRDLLIEIKPDPDKGSLRIAIGQLYDYRRFLNNTAATDLAVLTIGKPDQSYMDLLLVDRGITALWFEDESCQVLNGDGNGWHSLALALQKGSIPVAAAG
jgi:hypothetical protein